MSISAKTSISDISEIAEGGSSHTSIPDIREVTTRISDTSEVTSIKSKVTTRIPDISL
ncbi:hypothetical protein CHS0354_022196, partial [Potamilus streckersoni]